ncbi:uncharacterized protein DEA37_0001595, partial [Paragonimus westermani]
PATRRGCEWLCQPAKSVNCAAFPATPNDKKDLLVFERFIEGSRDLSTRQRFFQELAADLSCATRPVRSYAKATELAPEHDGKCMAVEPLTTPISVGDRACVLHRESAVEPWRPTFIRDTNVHEVLYRVNGQVERTNRSLKALLKAFTDRTSTRNWDVALPHCLLAHRVTVHTSTDHSPHSMVIGRELQLPVDPTLPLAAMNPLLASKYVTQLLHDPRLEHQLARNVLSGCQQQQPEYYDRKSMGHRYSPARRCTYIFQCRLLVLSDTICRIRDPGQPNMHSFTFHFNKLKPATQGMTVFPPSNRIVTNTEPPEAAMLVEIPAKGGTATEVAHPNIEDNVFLMEGMM